MNNMTHSVIWNAPNNIRTLITHRTFGNNKNFSLAKNIPDEKTNSEIDINRTKLSGLVHHTIYWLKQNHTDCALNIDLENNVNQYEHYDASFTHRKHNVCAVLTADCQPILITNKAGTVACAVHAGWKGVLNQVLIKTLVKLNENPEDLLIYIGPSILKCHFEVKKDVYDLFVNYNFEYAVFFEKINDDKYLGDLVSITKHQLLAYGINNENIHLSNLCTCCHKDTFFSYRQNDTYGRFASLIWME